MNRKPAFALIAILTASLSCSFLGSRLPNSAAPTQNPPSLATVYTYPSVTPLPTPLGYSVPPTGQSATSVPRPQKNLASHTSKIEKDVTYCTADNVDLKLDLYFPKSLNGPTPVVVYVHGGGWTSGSKDDGAGTVDFPALLDAGFIVGSVNYRLAPQAQFPAMIEDVKCAIRFLRTNASQYNINPNKIGAWGGSAGGHLVSLLGTTDQSAGFDMGQYLDQSSRVQAVVDMFGPADLTGAISQNYNNLKTNVFGNFDPAKASPVTYITPDDPPFLILQGDADTTVPLSQSQEFYNKLTAAGVPAQLVIVHGGPHGLNSPNETPSRSELTQMIVNFFNQHLK